MQFCIGDIRASERWITRIPSDHSSTSYGIRALLSYFVLFKAAPLHGLPSYAGRASLFERQLLPVKFGGFALSIPPLLRLVSRAEFVVCFG